MIHKSQTGLQKRISTVLAWLMLSCEQTSERISDSLDEKHTWVSRFRVGMHLLFCRFCRRYQRHLLSIRSILEPGATTTLGDYHHSVRLSSEASARIQQAIVKSDK